ncbi:MAG: hypothetical protein J7M16_06320, partial [Anaerolineae bacterium]|nr:hypothetical protein [Anaerolineae bacterium]
MKKRFIGIVAAVFVVIAVVCITTFVFGSERQIAAIDIGDGRSIRIWEENPSWNGWDPDITYPIIYYEITQSDTIIVPKTWLGLDFGYTYNIE